MDCFARTTDDIVSLTDFKALLASGRRLKIKFGADVTSGFLHLGHGVNLWMMREMQERGHKVQFLIGDFTTRVGDPTGRPGSRQPPSRETIERDAQAFIRQVGKVLVTGDPEVFEVRRNSEWWDSMDLSAFLEFAGGVTVGRLLSRDMFRARQEAGGEVRLDEMLYPILQGWDSVMLGSDLTIVGSDQLFNESMGRLFQERRGQTPQVIITTKITPGLDGVRKQSKSLNNFVAIDDEARTMFGKVMSLPDALLRDWFEVYTTLDPGVADRLCATDPRAAKLRLAKAIVERWKGPEAAEEEGRWFEETFSRKAFPEDAPRLRLPPGSLGALPLAEFLLPRESRSELRRLLEQGALRVDEEVLGPRDSLALVASREYRIRVGKRRFFVIMV